MKLAFVTAGLEPGHDGVGDYTRRLAAACARRGRRVTLIALADRHVGQPTETVSEIEGLSLPVQRLPLRTWLADGGRLPRTWLDAFAPDWVSFQFMPYSYHPRGWFSDSLPGFVTALGGRRLQLFFHEICPGSQKGATLVERLTNWRQHAVLRGLLRRLHPQRVQTSNGYYGAVLAGCGAPAEVLPVFGNVPVSTGEAPVEKVLPGLPERALVCGMYGTLHRPGLSDDFLEAFKQLAIARGRVPVLVSVGALGRGEALFDRLATQWRNCLVCLKLGRRSPAELSQIFRHFDFAVTSVPWNILGKSGTSAALREHGLKVVVLEPGSPTRAGGDEPDETARDEGCLPYFQDRSFLPSALAKTTPRPGVEAVAARFLAGLETSPSGAPLRNPAPLAASQLADMGGTPMPRLPSVALAEAGDTDVPSVGLQKTERHPMPPHE